MSAPPAPQVKVCPNPYCQGGWIPWEPNESGGAPGFHCQHPECPHPRPVAGRERQT